MRYTRNEPDRVKCPHCGAVVRKPQPGKPPYCLSCGGEIPEDTPIYTVGQDLPRKPDRK